ncbi:MAG: NAD(P)/FAD-dependent oxidoreductase [Methanophagales archaeon ANME-1-THS]|nr:MAG: NAD(P)/FAD-dependent oxidoreductase [Methanophagales archaeon ANME-1-THS]
MMQERECDVLVVGAGPAGLGAAITSSKLGLRTIVVEQSSEIGYPAKSSGLTWKEVVDDWNLPSRVISQWTSSFYLYSAHSTREVEIDFGRIVGGTLNFHIFLQELAFQAIRHGTKIILAERVSEPLMDGDFVCGVKTASGDEIRSKIVIDCSGPSAVIAKKAGLISPDWNAELGIGFEYEMLNYKVRNPNTIEYYVGEEEIVPVGYGWVLPTGMDRAKVGLDTVHSATESLEIKDMINYLNRFLGENSPIYNRVKDAQPFEVHSGVYSLSGMLDKPYSNGLMVAGDAASQASPLLGEGIRYALQFGKRAAETAVEATNANDVSEDYLKLYQQKCGEYLRETFEVASDLLKVPTDEYWEALLGALTRLKASGNTELVIKYLKTAMIREEAIEIFPAFEGKYL